MEKQFVNISKAMKLQEAVLGFLFASIVALIGTYAFTHSLLAIFCAVPLFVLTLRVIQVYGENKAKERMISDIESIVNHIAKTESK